MTVSVRQAGAWRTVPLTGRLQYLRIGGAWKPILDMWFRDKGQWVKEGGYSPQLAVPTNLRMNPADVNNHNTIPVAWDYNGLLPPDDFHVVVTNEGGSWLWEGAAASGARSMTLGAFGQNARYRVYVAARRAGRPDTGWAGPLNWALGKDSYVTNDVPVYGWGGEQEVMPSTYSQSSAANNDYGTWGFQKAQDGNFSSYWNSDIADPSLNANQGEGFRLWVPGNNYLLNGVRLWNLNYYTVWYGVNLNGNWQGGQAPYYGKYGFLVHGYNAGFNNIFNGDVRSGQYQTQGTGAYVDLLLQNPSYDGYNYRFGVVEARLLCQEWIQTGWGPRTVAAVNSAYW